MVMVLGADAFSSLQIPKIPFYSFWGLGGGDAELDWSWDTICYFID
ncbi:MAG: hypothetical protein Q4B28_06095 [bacterium]|nr:hypothetical protein [bacterium]